MVSQVSSELELTPLLQKIISTISTMLDCERATLFINDEKTSELYTEVGEGLDEKSVLRLPNHLGIAGAVFTSGKRVNIPHAYADLRFNPGFDKQTGFFTRSILCMPVFNKAGKAIGVSQVLNKRGGAFNKEDEKRLAAFTSQISMGIENAKLFDDVQNQKNYSESMLSSMHDAVITLDDEGVIKTCNSSGLRILKTSILADIVGKSADGFFTGPNKWLAEKLKDVAEKDEFLDAELVVDGETLSVNISVMPLMDQKSEALGSMVMIEDISSEKRMKSTMSRYMDPELADQLLEAGDSDDFLGGIGEVIGRNDRQIALLENASALIHFGTLQTHDQWYGEIDLMRRFH